MRDMGNGVLVCETRNEILELVRDVADGIAYDLSFLGKEHVTDGDLDEMRSDLRELEKMVTTARDMGDGLDDRPKEKPKKKSKKKNMKIKLSSARLIYAAAATAITALEEGDLDTATRYMQDIKNTLEWESMGRPEELRPY